MPLHAAHGVERAIHLRFDALNGPRPDAKLASDFENALAGQLSLDSLESRPCARLPIGLAFLSGRPAMRSRGASYFSNCLLSLASFLVGANVDAIGAGASPTNTSLMLDD
jgi:hypothetical protein